MIQFILISNDPERVEMAEQVGVSRFFVDLELLGKQERQGHLNTWISAHSVEDIGLVRSVLKNAQLIVRLNPLNPDSASEINAVIDQGAHILMIPMFRQLNEIIEFCRLVDGRADVMPLIETADAANIVSEVVEVAGVSEIYIGLNDLHLDLGLRFMFEPLANGLVDNMAKQIKRKGLNFGFGGVARVGEGMLPGELVLAEHARLESSSVILSRSFNGIAVDHDDEAFKHEFEKLQSSYRLAIERSISQVEADRDDLRRRVRKISEAR